MKRRCWNCSKKYFTAEVSDRTNGMCARCYIFNGRQKPLDLNSIAGYFGLREPCLRDAYARLDAIYGCVKNHQEGKRGHDIFVTAECLACRLRIYQTAEGSWLNVQIQRLCELAREYEEDPEFVINFLRKLSEGRCPISIWD